MCVCVCWSLMAHRCENTYRHQVKDVEENDVSRNLEYNSHASMHLFAHENIRLKYFVVLGSLFVVWITNEKGKESYRRLRTADWSISDKLTLPGVYVNGLGPPGRPRVFARIAGIDEKSFKSIQSKISSTSPFTTVCSQDIVDGWSFKSLSKVGGGDNEADSWPSTSGVFSVRIDDCPTLKI